jgi:outer membrane lipoprotein-sorting protein
MGMKHKYEQLSKYIDALNQEKMPQGHGAQTGFPEYEDLVETVRRVRTLREPEYPKEDYPLQLAAAVRERIKDTTIVVDGVYKRQNSRFLRRMLYFAAATAAAVTIIFLVPKLILPGGDGDIVYAMEKAFEEIEAYHGILSVVETNELGETITQAGREVWADSRGNYYVKELEGTAKEIVTINNGERKWQLRPQERSAYLFDTFPDPYRFTFELSQEIEEVKAAQTVKELGEERIAGRNTTVLQVTPEGGDSYRLWIDRETKLPLQRETAMQNAIQYKVTYTSIEFVPSIPEELLQYQVPEGYAEVDTTLEQIVNAIEEAKAMADFLPVVIDQLPEGYSLSKIAIRRENNALRLYYISQASDEMVMIEQSKATEEFKADSRAVLGKVDGHIAEILVNPDANGVRWQEAGMEYSVIGNIPFDKLLPFLKELTRGEIVFPDGVIETTNGVETDQKAPEVPVEYDIAIEETEQKSVDAGHSPWKLDPVFVTQVFASLLLSPEGIVGDYPIAYEDIEMIENDGTRAIAMIKSKNTIADYVYLERLVRQDETGIWTVVGYDKVE